MTYYSYFNYLKSKFLNETQNGLHSAGQVSQWMKRIRNATGEGVQKCKTKQKKLDMIC